MELDPLKTIGDLDTLQTKINKWHSQDEQSLELLKQVIDDEVYWSDKGIKNNKDYDKDEEYDEDYDSSHDDFTPPLILEYRAILSTNTTTQKDKIKAIKAVSIAHQNQVKESGHILSNNEKEINMVSREASSLFEYKNIDYANHVLNNIKSKISETHTNQIEIKDYLFKKLETIIITNEANWQNKGINLGGYSVPDGIEKCNEVLVDKRKTPYEKINAIFMICKEKYNVHQSRKDSLLFSKPTHPDVTAFYKQMTELSDKWYNGQLLENHINDLKLPTKSESSWKSFKF
jgi:hypothetical protein